ncbi:MAG: pentapeptide repeat-containing protein [Bacteroidota bacterium]
MEANEKIFSNDFLKSLIQGKVQNLSVINSFTLEESKGLTDSLIITNCTFEKEVSISGCNFKGLIVFKNCIFNSAVKISESVFRGDLQFNGCIFSNSLKIDSCSFNYLKFDGGEVEEVCFLGTIKSIDGGKVQFMGGDFKKIRIEVKLFECELEIKSASIYEIFFLESDFQDNVMFDGENLAIDWLFMEKCSFNKRLDFKKGTISGFLDFRKSNFYDTVLLYPDFKIKQLNLNNVSSGHSFTLNYFKNIDSISISSCHFEDEFLCHTDYNEEIINDNLSISLNGVIKGKLIFENLSISHFNVGATNLGIISINNVDVWNFTAVSLFNLNSFIINNLKSNSRTSFFVISESNVGKMELLNTNLKLFAEVIIVNSNVSEIVLSNSVLPEIIQIASENPRIGYGPSKEILLEWWSFYRETYRQLKIASEKQGNRNQALRYKAKEFYYLRKELDFGWDKILLYLNYISNNHGISWSRSVLFTLLTAFVFFILYNQTLPDKYFYWTFDTTVKETYQAFLTGLSGYVDFLLSFPRIVVNEEKQLRVSSKLTILLARIFMGYGIYQTISAFRKYGKT